MPLMWNKNSRNKFKLIQIVNNAHHASAMGSSLEMVEINEMQQRVHVSEHL